MRPVNLLPAEHRSYVPSGDGRSGYIALGVLGVLLLMLLGLVLTGNSVNSRKGQIAEAKRQTAEANKKAGAQSAFGDFHEVEQTRVASVTQVASDRFDWERLIREMSLVLPRGTSVNELNASKGPQADGSTSTSSTSTASTDPAASGLPSLHLVGCADKQHDVADMLVRLRQMHGVESVDLAESAEQSTEGDGSGGGAAGDSASGGGSDSCAPGTFKFDVTVTFEQEVAGPAGQQQQRVPARLGGGS